MQDRQEDSCCLMFWESVSVHSHELVMVEPQLDQDADWRSKYLQYRFNGVAS